MSAPPPADGSPDPGPTGDAPFLPPARPTAPVSTGDAEPAAPFLPSPPPPTVPAPPASPAFDAKAMVASQKHPKLDPAYGAMPAGTDEGRAAARRLREDANRKRRRNRRIARLVGFVVLAGLTVGAYFAVQAFRDDTEEPADDAAAAAPAADAADGALTPLGEQEQVIEALDDLNSGATPSAGGLLEAVEDAREVVGQAQPPVGTPATLMVADVFTPAVLDHTEVLGTAEGWERFVVRTADLVEVNPSAHTALVDRLIALPQVATDDAQLARAPVVPPGDVGIAIRRDGDAIAAIVAVATEPAISAVGP